MPWNYFRIALVIIFFATILVVFPFVGYSYLYEKPCDTAACFIARADDCYLASYENVVGTANVKYVTRHGCIVEKIVTSLAETEPDKAKELFEGASMECPYTRGDFPPEFLNSLTAESDSCEGLLKDIIDLS